MAKVGARKRLSKEHWVQAALEAIAQGGLAAVGVASLADRLGVTKGSFYWHFSGREELIEAALAEWERAHTTSVIAEIVTPSTDPLQQLRLLFKRASDLTARNRIEVALLATADDPIVGRALERVMSRRLDFGAQLFERFGLSPAEAYRRALLTYSVYLGYTQLVHATPAVLPRSPAARRAYLDETLAALTAPGHPTLRPSQPARATRAAAR